MKKTRVVLLFFAALSIAAESLACTAALVHTSRSSEGAPMLWKHRDSPDWDCHFAYVEGGKYAYTALRSRDLKHTYCGINETGFAILNTVSENLTVNPSVPKSDLQAITYMNIALSDCATVDEFEEVVRSTNGRRPYVTNYAVGDATGAIAFFEVWSDDYKRYEVKDCEEGFDVRSNFSFSGDMVTPGPSVPRYDITMRNMKGKRQHKPYDFIEYTRNFENGEGVDVISAPGPFVCNDLTVPRYFSVADMVAICDKENPRMLVVIGHPLSGMAVPVYVNAKGAIPRCAGGAGDRAALELSEEVRAKVYTKVAELKYDVNKTLVEELLKVETKCKMPKAMPKDIERFNAKVDACFERHATKIRNVLSRY